MSTNFDIEIDRKHTGSVKWGFIMDQQDTARKSRTNLFFGRDRMLPMWVADMDFQSPEPVIHALKERAKHGIFGYTQPDQRYLDAVADWMRKRHAWNIEKEWIVTTPGVVPGLHLLIRALTRPGDRVLIQQPAYYPFFSAIKENNCQIISNPLTLSDNRYQMDFNDLEDKAADPDVKLAILCNPHNPVGRVWTPDELRQFGDICRRHSVQVIADEIHGDLIYPGEAFTPFVLADPAAEVSCITCTAPSKTFNLAGLQTSNIIIPDVDNRKKLQGIMRANGLFGVNPFGMVACRAAYEQGEPWLDALLRYLKKNLDSLIDLFDRKLPEVPVIRPEGTYLVWIDFRSLGLDNQGLRDLILNQARVYLDDGFLFGPEGDGFQRINIACPQTLLMEALERIITAVKGAPATSD